jgi:hypothetical protein
MCDTNNKCRTTCTQDSDCVTTGTPGNYCAGGKCVAKKADGTMCANNDECGSGSCVESVCCHTAGCGQCQSCALAGHLGQCTLVDAGMLDPSGTCKNQGSMGCGTTGACDSVGKCAYQDGSVMCAAAMCSGADLLSARFCDGKGTCATGTATDCTPFSCNASMIACFSTCADDTSCNTPGYTCDVPNAQCVPVPPPM